MSKLPGVNVAPPGNDERVGGIAFTLALELPLSPGCLQKKNKIFIIKCNFFFSNMKNLEDIFFFNEITLSTGMSFDWTLNEL